MKRRRIGLGMGLLTMMLLSSCSNVQEPVGRYQQVDEVVGGEPIATMEPEITQAPIVSQRVKKDNKEYKMQAINLTEQNDTEIGIDYSIEGYDVLQEFGYELFEQNIEESNLVLSPTSAYLALALAGSGAVGDTQKEFVEVLGDLECIPNDLMMNLPREKEGMTISIANSAWVDEKMNPTQEWLAWADSVYQSEVFQTKLSTEEAMTDMNQWIDINTNGLIPKLLTQPLDSDARLALFNTVYFKGDWKNEFLEEYTRKMDFTLADGTIQQVEMMQLFEENLKYTKNEVFEGVILPYEDESMSFVALKPIEDVTVRDMYDKLNKTDISQFLQQEGTTLCNLRLPKFEVEFDKVLNDSLQAMGLSRHL